MPSKIYIGTTNNIQRRLEQHNQGDSQYTQTYKPWEIICLIEFKQERQAYQFEKYLKSGSGFAFMKKRLLPK